MAGGWAPSRARAREPASEAPTARSIGLFSARGCLSQRLGAGTGERRRDDAAVRTARRSFAAKRAAARAAVPALATHVHVLCGVPAQDKKEGSSLCFRLQRAPALVPDPDPVAAFVGSYDLPDGRHTHCTCADKKTYRLHAAYLYSGIWAGVHAASAPPCFCEGRIPPCHCNRSRCAQSGEACFAARRKCSLLLLE